MPDENVPDENVPDENVPDENVPDENVPDENVPDENVPDENGSDPVEPDQEQTDAARSADRPHRRVVRISAAAVIAVLTGLLGFAIVVQVHQNSSTDNLANLREDDLVGILDNQNARADRLRQQIADLQQTLRRLQDSGDRSAAARQQVEQDAQALGVLLGTLPAFGPGVMVRVTDPHHKLGAEDVLDVVEELRGAGAEAIQFGTVRVSTTTAFTDVGAGTAGATVAVDGRNQTQPYDVLAIGDSKTLDTALNIPGGAAAAIRNAGGDLTVGERGRVTILVTRALPTPKHLTPSGH